MKIKTLVRLMSATLLLAATHYSNAQTTAFTYQGKLIDDCCPATGYYDLTFKVFDDPTAGTQLPTPTPITVTTNCVPVTNGLFIVSLDFGSSVFTGARRWLQIDARTNNPSLTPVTLLPRTELTPTPYALFAKNAAGVANSGVTVAALGTLAPPTSGQVLTYNGSGLAWGNGASSGGWSLTGNGGTTPGLNFLGTTDGQPLEMRASFIGINRNSPITGAEYFGIHVPVTGGYGGMYVEIPGVGKPFYGYTVRSEFGIRSYAWHYMDGLDGNKWKLRLGVDNFHSGVDALTVTPDPYVGIGTDAPDRPLSIKAANPLGYLEWLSLMDTGGATRWHLNGWNGGLNFVQSGVADFRLYLGADGKVGIGTASPQAKLDIAGDMRTSVLTITGGADLAEPFLMSSKDIPKGALVIIDETNAGQLKMSDRAYDTRVAGILSGANGITPGISLHQEGALEGGQNVALSGRAYALADASHGPIKPGDLLTTSATPGHCMKATDHTRAQGAIIGKAMSSLATGKGMVLVLVSLQ